MRENEYQSYLLGQLSESAQSQLELRLLSQNDAFDQLLVAEDDLVEAFLQGELSAAEKARFEHIFLAHPARQRHLSLVQTLQLGSGNSSQSQTVAVGTSAVPNAWSQFLGLLRKPLWQLAALALILGVILGLRYLWMRNSSLRESASPIASISPRVVPVPTSPPGTGILSEKLSSGQVMAIGSEKKILHLTPAIGQVKLELGLQKDRYETYKVALQSYDPAMLKELPGEFKRQGTKDQQFIQVLIPVTDLQGQDFTIKVDGITADGERHKADTFPFKVKRE